MTWNNTLLNSLVELAPKGDVCEVGVYKGLTFKKLCALAPTRIVRAFDSFYGMDEPSIDDGGHYPYGKFGIGGVRVFHKLMEGYTNYRVHPGYIPNCFVEGLEFALAFLDVDHYEATRLSLHYLWPKIVKGGFLALDDYIPSQSDILATKAIVEFLSVASGYEIFEQPVNQLILRKL